MTYSYKASSRAFSFPQEENRWPTNAAEHHFDGSSDSDGSSTLNFKEDITQVPGLPSGLMLALTCGIGG